MKKKTPRYPGQNGETVARNRKARHLYTIGDTLEAGIQLSGSEVKSLREGKVNIAESYAAEEENEIWLINASIAEYSGSNRFNHAPRRKRRLLLHRREIRKLIGMLQQKGITLIPLSLYFTRKGLAKLQLGIATGKKQYEKREDKKKQDWEREKARIMKGDLQ